MEKRHFDIKERAGLEESRYSQDFIDFLNSKWAVYILMALAIVALGYVVYQKREQAKIVEISAAFRDLGAASGAFSIDRVALANIDVDRKGIPLDANPDNLMQIARDYKSVKGLPALAKLTAADALLRTTRTGMKPGSELSPDGTPANKEDLLTDEQRKQNLDQAESLYSDVLAQARKESGSTIAQVNALYGLAAVAESRGKFDDAKAHYETIVGLVDNTPFKAHARVSRNRIAGLPALAKLPTLMAKTDYPRIAGLDPDPKPAPAPSGPAPGSGVLAPPPDPSAPAAPQSNPAPESAKPGDAATPPPASAPAPAPAPAPK